MNVDGSVEDVVVAVTNFVQERLAGFHTAAGFGQAGEQVELDGGERERRGVEHDGAGIEVEAQRTDGDFGGRSFGAGCDGGAERAAADDGAQAGEELAGGKRFRQIVVGADFEADDAVGFIAARGEHEHGYVTAGADFLQDLETVHAGEHHVEDESVPGLVGSGGAFDALGASVDGGNVEAEGFEIGGDETAEFPIVVDHQEARAAVGGVGHGAVLGETARRGKIGRELDGHVHRAMTRIASHRVRDGEGGR